jgi:hypothetical protein
MKGKHGKSLHLRNDPVETLEQHALRSSQFSVKSFKNHLSKAFGLGRISEESAILPIEEDESPTAPGERLSLDSVIQSCGEQSFQNIIISSHANLEPSNTSYKHEHTSTLRRLPSFIEIKCWWKEKLIRQCNEEEGDFNYLDEDSPLKGKEKAIWRKREPEIELWKARSVFPSVPTQIGPLKASKVQSAPSAEKRSHQKRKSEAKGGNFELRFHRKQDEGDNRQDVILKFPSQATLRHHG